MKFTALAVVLCLMLSACLTVDKAQRHLEKKKVLDDICAAEFPAKTTGQDSAAYKAGMAKIDSLFEAYYSAISGIDPESPPVIPPAGDDDGDSLIACEDELQGMYRAAVNRERLIVNLTKTVDALKAETKNLAPKIIYRADSAVLQGLHDRIATINTSNETLVQLLAESNSDRDTWKGRAKKRFWTIVGLGGVGLLILLLAILKRKAKK